MDLVKLVHALDELLRTKTIKDSSRNGLQVDGPRQVKRVAFAVDACQAAFDAAVGAHAQLLIVHHGLFWDKVALPVGANYRRLKTLFDGGVSLYASHLPLDSHPKIGNNAALCRGLGLKRVRPFAEYHGAPVGLGGDLPRPLPVEKVAERVAALTGSPVLRVQACGKRPSRRVGCVSGGAAFGLAQAIEAGFDTYVTGEPSHGAFHDAEELGLNVVFGGHYATETLGLKELAKHLERRFGLTTTFLDVPTGL